MAKTTAASVLVQGADIKAFKLKNTPAVKKAIELTMQKQVEVLKLKDVDQDRLKMVVKL